MKTTTKLLLGAVVFTGLAYVYYRYKKPKKSGLNKQPQPQPQPQPQEIASGDDMALSSRRLSNKLNNLRPKNRIVFVGSGQIR